MLSTSITITLIAAHLAVAALHVPVPSGGSEIPGSDAVRTEEGLSVGKVRTRTEGAAFPAVARVPYAYGHGSRQDARDNSLWLVQEAALA